jgi:hypothetical protein
MIHFFVSLASMVSLTVDGWSNPSMKGFHVATLHWITRETGKRSSIILDFFRVPGGTGSAKRVGGYLFELLNLYGLGRKLLCTISDNASDAVASTVELGRLLCVILFHRLTSRPKKSPGIPKKIHRQLDLNNV